MPHTSLDLAAIIHASGYRLTAQRQIILDTLCATGGHVTVSELYRRVHAGYPAIDRSTLYRVLDFFSELDLVIASEVGGVIVYEIAAGNGAGAHRHLVCRGCGHVTHAPGAPFDALAARLQTEHGFAAELEGITVYGRCRACSDERSQSSG